tara:strand:- start:74 stop:460 length:387 start_codon:yes stop_codon:yes gene_type:complete
MKITKQQLKQIIKEEINEVMNNPAAELSSRIKQAVPHARGPGAVAKGPDAYHSGLKKGEYGIRCPAGRCVVVWHAGITGLSFMHLMEIEDKALDRVHAAMEEFGYKENRDAWLPDVGTRSQHERGPFG